MQNAHPLAMFGGAISKDRHLKCNAYFPTRFEMNGPRQSRSRVFFFYGRFWGLSFLTYEGFGEIRSVSVVTRTGSEGKSSSGDTCRGMLGNL